MQKASTLTIFLLSLFSALNAQKKLESGFIVLNNNDTVKGFIDYREWYTNPNGIVFTPTANVKTKHYAVTDISYFEITGKEAYQRSKVNISLDPALMKDLLGKDTSSKNEVVFLKVLLQGKNVSLFSYSDDIKMRLYILKQNETIPTELLNSIYLRDGQVVNEREFRLQLTKIASIYLPGNQEIPIVINNTDYSKKAILNICNTINGREKNEINNSAASSNIVRFFAGAGVNKGSLNFTGNNHYAGTNPADSYFPVASLGADIFVNPSVGRLFFRSLAAVTAFSMKDYTVEKYYEATENYSYALDQLNFSLHGQLMYNLYNGTSFKWFIGGGGGINISSYSKNQEVLVRQGLVDTNTYTGNNYVYALKKFWLNASITSGFSIRNFEICLMYFPNSDLSGYKDYSLENSSFQVRLNYLFNRKKIR